VGFEATSAARFLQHPITGNGLTTRLASSRRQGGWDISPKYFSPRSLSQATEIGLIGTVCISQRHQVKHSVCPCLRTVTCGCESRLATMSAHGCSTRQSRPDFTEGLQHSSPQTRIVTRDMHNTVQTHRPSAATHRDFAFGATGVPTCRGDASSLVRLDTLHNGSSACIDPAQ
jgi:hypothetical protein